MPAPVDLVNMALLQIVSNQTITSINPPSPPNSTAAKAASLLYQTQVDATFRAVHWNCARFQAAATLLAAQWGTPQNPNGTLPKPPQPWLYMYAYPDDCLLVRFVFPLCLPPAGSTAVMTNVGVGYRNYVNTSLPFVPASALDANGNSIRVILTNCPQAQIVYTKRIPDPNLWDAGLINAVTNVLAAWLVNPVARSAELLKERVSVAVASIEAARLSDGNEGITSTDSFPDWINVRNAGSSWGWNLTNGGFYGGWDNLGMPNGMSY